MTIAVARKQSSHFDERKGGVRPSFLILHYTMTHGPDDPDGFFTGTRPHPEGKRVSAHYMIGEDGSIAQYVDEEKRAWHAGVSYWDGMDDLNSRSIGIELVNPGHDLGYRPFPEKQMQAVIALCADIMKRHAIPARHVLAHSDIAPSRKTDPGELFDWKRMAGAGVGVWPAPLQEDFGEAAQWTDEAAIREALVRYGYNPQEKYPDLVTAFQRHFQPEVFVSGGGKPGVADAHTTARLAALIRMKKAAVLNP